MNKLLVSSIVSLSVLGFSLEVKAAQFHKTHNWNLNLRANERYEVAWQGRALAVASKGVRVDNPGNLPPTLVPPIGGANVTATTGLALALANDGGGGRADAIASMVARPNGTGSHTLKGNTILNRSSLVGSDAVSSVAIRKVRVNGAGMITWAGQWFINTIQSGFEDDPVFFAVTNLDTGETIETELFKFEVDLEGLGEASWQNGVVSLNALNGTMLIEMDSPFITSDTGTLFVEFSDGVITESNDNGFFDGLLPVVGSPSNFSFPLGDANSNIDIAYDFGAENTNGYEFNITLGARASIQENQSVPEPSSILGLLAIGILGTASTLKHKLR